MRERVCVCVIQSFIHVCDRWQSGFSWFGEEQQCKRCNTWNDAKEKRPLQNHHRYDDDDRLGAHHDINRCTKCQRLGRDCSDIYRH